MTDMAPEAQAPPAPAPLVPVTMDEAMDACLRAIKVAAENSSSASDTREMDEAGKAALAFAQAFITLDPDRLQGGDTPQGRLASVPELPPTSDGDGDGRVGE